MLDSLFIYAVLQNELPPHPNMLLKVIRRTSSLSCWAVDERLSDDKTLRGSCSLERDRSCLRASFIARTALNICRSKLYIRTSLLCTKGVLQQQVHKSPNPNLMLQNHYVQLSKQE
jgi:hypothetical protein